MIGEPERAHAVTFDGRVNAIGEQEIERAVPVRADCLATLADRVPDVPAAGKLAGKLFSELNTLAREANEEALASDGRPSDTWLLDRLDAETLGGLLYALMATVAYEGELLGVCAYDQPGVEAYKSIMRARLS